MALWQTWGLTATKVQDDMLKKQGYQTEQELLKYIHWVTVGGGGASYWTHCSFSTLGKLPRERFLLGSVCSSLSLLHLEIFTCPPCSEDKVSTGSLYNFAGFLVEKVLELYASWTESNMVLRLDLVLWIKDTFQLIMLKTVDRIRYKMTLPNATWFMLFLVPGRN